MLTSLTEYMQGRDGIRSCIRCGHVFEPTDQWLKILSRDGAIAVGLCDSCAAQTAARSLNVPERGLPMAGGRE